MGFIRTYTEFQITLCKHYLLRKVGNVLVALHVRTTPHRATPDTLNEIIQEQLAAGVRAIEFKAESLKQRYERLGKELLHDDTATEIGEPTEPPSPDSPTTH